MSAEFSPDRFAMSLKDTSRSERSESNAAVARSNCSADPLRFFAGNSADALREAAIFTRLCKGQRTVRPAIPAKQQFLSPCHFSFSQSVISRSRVFGWARPRRKARDRAVYDQNRKDTDAP